MALALALPRELGHELCLHRFCRFFAHEALFGPMVASPCIGVCKLDPVTKLCLGCHRTVDEISSWLDLDEDERKAIIARLNASVRKDSKAPTG